MDLLKYILAPFEFIIREIYLISYGLTENHGLSVVLLSLAISLLLLPVFILIERSKKRDDAVKRRMKPLLEEIKRSYRGQERYYYIRTLHRQHGYNSFKSLVPVLTLLLQIPFFIAAYQFLEHFEPLSGQSFLFIQDLSEPDELMGSINLLPIIMTLVNLVTAYFYTRNGDTGERKQMLVVAGLFLVLLYNFPSGLVLYWTMNNVFSFFRLFITHPEVFRKNERLSDDRKSGFSGMTGVVSVLQKAIAGRTNGILVRSNAIAGQQAGIWGTVKAILKAGISLLRVKFKHAFNFYTGQIRSHSSLFKIAFGIILLLVVASQLHWALQHNFNDFALRMVVSPVAALLLTMVIAAGYVLLMNLRNIVSDTPIKPVLHLLLLFFAIYFYFAAKFYFSEQNSALTLLAVLFTLALQYLSLVYFVKSRGAFNSLLFQTVSAVTGLLHLLQGINLIAILSGEDFSIQLMNSQLTIGSSPWLAIVATGIIISFITVPFYLKSSKIVPQLPPGHHWLIMILSVLYIAGLVFFWNPMIVYSSYPKNFEFPAIDFLTNNYGPFILVTGICLMVYLLTPGKLKHLLVKLFVSIAFVFFLYSSIIPFDAGTLQVSLLSNEENLAKPVIFYIFEALLLLAVIYGAHRLAGSNRVKYVAIGLLLINLLLAGQSLYLAIDTGSFFTKETNENSEIPFSKEGENIVLFVIDGAQGWYMHDLVEEDPALREVFSGFTYYPNTLAMANYTYASVPSIMCGYDYSIAGMNRNEEKTIIEKVTDATELFYDKVKEGGFDFTSTILRYSGIDRDKFDNYIPSWHDSWSELLGLGNPEEMWYTRLWENALFSGVPLFLKPGVYNHTKWVMKEKSNLNLTELYQYHFVKLLPEISNINNQNPNFIYIHSLFTHNPWGLINGNNQFVRDVTPYESQHSFTYTFAEWIGWMKEVGIYDNTRIILVSDHGPSWWHFNGEITTTAPIVWTEEEKISLERFLHLNALLMVKDFNSDGPLREDWRLMNIADVSAIAFDENDPTKSDSVSRTLPTFFTTWHTDLKTRTKFENKHAFEVTDYVYDLNNWKAIQE